MSAPLLRTGGMYAIKHTSRSTRSVIRELNYRVDINSLHRDDSARTLELNEIGRATLRTTAPLCFHEYRRNRATGGFILIDEATSDTVAAGIILGATDSH